ncbi:MAG: serine/threonine-protein kinase [Flavobacterium sp.]|nr:serine/threonine-protein kinase [Flavobacterium sp.]
MNYKVIKTIGQGGFGIVDLIEEKGSNEKYALKTFSIHPSMKLIEDQAKKRFIKEAKYQQTIDHPNIVPIIEVSKGIEPPYFIMPLASTSMFDEIQSGILNETNFLSCLYDVMAGLEEIHSLSIYHRDLKPGNVLKFKDSYAVGDFGLMSLNSTGVTTLTSTGMSKTSDLYTAPEITQDLKFASVQSDIYSLGCMLHDFIGEHKRIPCNEISESTEYGNLLLSATRKDPTRRFSSVAAFREALSSISNRTAPTRTLIAGKVLNSLKNDIDTFDENAISLLTDFLSSAVTQDEKNTILGEIKLLHIEKIVLENKHGAYIAKVYCDYVRNSSFGWDFCDTLANRIIAFMNIGTIDIISEGIFALLYMGTRHNRFYVERKAIQYFCGEIENKLLQRIIMEIRVDGDKFCDAINHLFRSINYNKSDLNTEIQKIIKAVCR